MRRFKLTIEYDGTGLAGWQRQHDCASVQGYLEAAAEKLTGQFQEVIGAGRTDAGVHARAQVAHLDIYKDTLSPYNILHGLNYHLEPLTRQVVVTQADEVEDSFHARFSAISRTYRYRIVNRPVRLAVDIHRAWHIPEPLDAEAMHEAAQCLLGHHDFTTFRSTICQSKSPLKTLDRLDIFRSHDEIQIVAQARSFLHHQVRNMVGTLRLIGNKKWNNSRLADALEAKDRTKGGETAPPEGLYFMSAAY